MSVPAGADPGIFVGGGSNLPKNFDKPKKKQKRRGRGYNMYSAIVMSKSIFAMETALQISYVLRNMTSRGVFYRHILIRYVCFSFVKKKARDFTVGAGVLPKKFTSFTSRLTSVFSSALQQHHPIVYAYCIIWKQN